MDLTETEILMKSLVLSCPLGLTIEQLDRDFKNEVGNSIPFKNFGYVSLESMISSLDKTFNLVRKDGKIYVQAKSSNKTKHIECMIAAQKKKKNPPRRSKFSKFPNRETNIPRTIRYAVNSNEMFGNRQSTNDSNIIKYNNIQHANKLERYVGNYKYKDHTSKLFSDNNNKAETVVYKSIFGEKYNENRNNLKKVQFNDWENQAYALDPSLSFSEYLSNKYKKCYPIPKAVKEYKFSDFLYQQYNSKENDVEWTQFPIYPYFKN